MKSVIRKSMVTMAYSTVILAVGVLSFIYLLSIPGARAQPAVYSAATGILEIPNLQLDERGVSRNVNESAHGIRVAYAALPVSR